MGNMAWGIILSLFLVALILSLVYSFQKKQLRKKDVQIHELRESLSDLQAKLKEKERRKTFRIKLFEQECTFELIEFGDKLLERLKHKIGKGKIRDISLTGMKMACEYDLPVRKGIYLQLHFVLQNEEFSFKGKIVRKEELLNDLIYGIEFMEVNAKEQQRLYLAMQRLEIERRKKSV